MRTPKGQGFVGIWDGQETDRTNGSDGFCDSLRDQEIFCLNTIVPVEWSIELLEYNII